MSKQLRGDGSRGLDLDAHAGHLKNRPVTVTDAKTKQSSNVRIVLVCWVRDPGAIPDNFFSIGRYPYKFSAHQLRPYFPIAQSGRASSVAM